MPGEFDLIRTCFQQATGQRDDVVLGIGDDCALLQTPADQQLAASMDTLVCGCHFLPDADPTHLGHKALAVNLSDMAAMGAEPAWFSLGLTLPDIDPHWQDWLKRFMHGLGMLAQGYRLQLIGGDTTRGPLSITVQIHGFVPAGQAMRRDAAHVGDRIYVSGTLGDAGLALRLRQQNKSHTHAEFLTARLNRPTPRVELGLALRGVAHAAIDLSDGLGGDLAHICAASKAGARIRADALPLSGAVKNQVHADADWRLPLSAGDDYELLFTTPADQTAAVEHAARQSGTRVSCIGEIQAGEGIRLVMPDGSVEAVNQQGYDHFSASLGAGE